MMQPARFLSVEDVLALHAIAIEDQGGDASLRDRPLLESAVATPSQTFGGEFLHSDIPAMAAAYAFHICKNHPFVDGNKRAAAAAMIAFLSDNGWRFDAAVDDAERVFLGLAAGALSKEQFTNWARTQMHQMPRMELREFFRQVNPIRFTNTFRSLLPGETGAPPNEFAQRSTEAMNAMPFLRDLARQQQEAHNRNDKETWDRITMLSVGMMALYTIAEELGYEW